MFRMSEEQQGGGTAEEQRKEGSWREARGLSGPGHSGQCPLSEHHCCVNPETGLPSSPFKAGEMRLCADDIEQGIRHRCAQGHTTLGLAL